MDLMDKIISLCKRRGFVFPSSQIYGGLANSWDFGPLGSEMKKNIKNEWWKIFVHQRDDMVGMDSAIIMNPKVWEASGHTTGFSDPLSECKKCHRRFRLDHLIGDEVWNKEKEYFENSSEEKKVVKVNDLVKKCPGCGESGFFTSPQNFNLMLKTFLGVVDDKSSLTYLRPETAQGTFVNFKNILNSSRQNLPFGIAQIGKSFRNEITPGNYIFRTREFEQMEIEYFIKSPKNDKEWQDIFEGWRANMENWIKHLGIDYSNKINELDIPKEDLSHYSKKTIDFEYHFPFGIKELYGLAYRTDFDLKSHDNYSGENMKYKDQETKEEYWPHVIEPAFGVERTLLAVLCEAYNEEKVSNDDMRIVMKFPYWLAPVKIAVLPLMKKDEITKKSKEIYDNLKKYFLCQYDESGSIGKRYRRQDEIGTPFCITIDFESLDGNDVTIRNRDTMQQERIKIDDLLEFFKKFLN